MLFPPVNIKHELLRERLRQNDLLKEAQDLLTSAHKKDLDVLKRLNDSDENILEGIHDIDTSNIFSLEHIRSICIRYRLRFLDSTHFKAEYPFDAVAEINAFEKKYGVKTTSFRIIAPAEAFDLENINKDPLLFAQLSNNSFYLIHQWGRELKWHRRILSWPFQSFKTLMISISIFCFIFAFSIPTEVMHVFNVESEMYLRIWLTIHTFIGLLGLTLWAGLAFDKSFSSMNWDSKYYNY